MFRPLRDDIGAGGTNRALGNGLAAASADQSLGSLCGAPKSLPDTLRRQQFLKYLGDPEMAAQLRGWVVQRLFHHNSPEISNVEQLAAGLDTTSADLVTKTGDFRPFEVSEVMALSACCQGLKDHFLFALVARADWPKLAEAAQLDNTAWVKNLRGSAQSNFFAALAAIEMPLQSQLTRHNKVNPADLLQGNFAERAAYQVFSSSTEIASILQQLYRQAFGIIQNSRFAPAALTQLVAMVDEERVTAKHAGLSEICDEPWRKALIGHNTLVRTAHAQVSETAGVNSEELADAVRKFSDWILKSEVHPRSVDFLAPIILVQAMNGELGSEEQPQLQQLLRLYRTISVGIEELIEREKSVVEARAFRISRQWGRLDMSEDLQVACRLAVYDAIHGFEPERGVNFRTYFNEWCFNYAYTEMYDHSSTIRVPRWVRKESSKVYRFSSQFQAVNERAPTADELKAESLRPECLEYHTRARSESLDAPVSSHGEVSLGQLLVNEAAVEPLDLINDRDEVRRILEQAISELGSKDQTILRHRFGLADIEKLTLDQLAKKFGVTSGRISQLQMRAIERLRRKLTTAGLKQRILSELGIEADEDAAS